MIRRKTLGATLALGTVFGLGLLFTSAQPAAAHPAAHGNAYGSRSNHAQHRYGPGFGSRYYGGRFGARGWGSNARRPFAYGGTRFPAKKDLDRDGIRNKHDRDKDGDGVRNRRDDRPNNPLRR